MGSMRKLGLPIVPAFLSLLILGSMDARGAEGRAVFSCGIAASGLRGPGLCKALETELRRRFSGLTIESQVSDQASVKGRRIEFAPGKMSRNGISGRLKWRADDRAEWITGPMIQTVVMDAALNDETLREFARTLVDVSKF